MNGIFGGFLAIVDSIGGGFLYILIGEAASKTGAGARLMRLIIGALLFGALVSLAIYLSSPEVAFQRLPYQNTSTINEGTLPILFIPPAATLVLTAVLELLRFGIEHRSNSPEASKLRITPSEEKKQPTTEQTKQVA